MSRQLRQAAALFVGPAGASDEPMLVIEAAFRARGWSSIRCSTTAKNLEAWLDHNGGTLPEGFVAKIMHRADTILVIPPPPKR